MTAREVVECNGAGGICNGDHHGWACPLSDPHGDVLRAIDDGGPLANPILERVRLDTLDFWLT